MKKILSIVFLCVFVACKKTNTSTKSKVVTVDSKKYKFDLQGHRGARGLLPENTLIAFKKALDIEVTTVELDVVITKDKKVLVSHEPWLNADICLDSLGNKILKKEQMKYNIYTYNYDQVKKIDCGILGNPRFPNQQKIKSSKPLLSEVIDLVENYNKKHNTTVSYNIEIKSDPRGDNLYHPVPSEFTELVIAVLKDKNINNRLVLQSFDRRVLKYIHEKYSAYTLAYLVEEGSFQDNLALLNFEPKIYSPNYELLSKEDIGKLHKKGIKVIPWTVNEKTKMLELLNWGVDGIITDYPNIAKKLHQ